MYSIVLTAVLAAGGDIPAHKPYPHARTGFRGFNPCYNGGWWYGATAWDGCPPVYVCPKCPAPSGSDCCGFGPPPWHSMPAFAPSLPMTDETPAPRMMDETPMPKPIRDEASRDPNRAKLILEVPVGARLYLEDKLIETPAGRRELVTPALKPGQKYCYDLRLEVVRDGQTHCASRQVVVRAGEEVRASFTDAGSALDARAAVAPR